MACLDDVAKAIDSNFVSLYANMVVYIVNYHAPYPFPRRFLYKACVEMTPSRRQCSRSLENSVRCGHQSGRDVDIYRFDLILVDGSRSGKPLKATVFDAASEVTSMLASEFRKLSERQQKCVMNAFCLNTPECLVTIRVSKGIAVIEQIRSMATGPLGYVRRVGARSSCGNAEVECSNNHTPDEQACPQQSPVGSVRLNLAQMLVEAAKLLSSTSLE